MKYLSIFLLSTKKLLLSNVFAILTFSLTPVLILYQHNMFESNILDIGKPAMYCLLFAIVMFCIVKFFFKNASTVFIVSWVFIFLFFSYGHIYLALSRVAIIATFPISLNKILLIAYFVAILFLFLLLKKIQKLNKVASYLKVISYVSVLISLFTIVPFEIGNRYVESKLVDHLSRKEESIKFRNKDKSSYPDIYYVVFDRYARSDVLKKYFNFDNTEHLDWLQVNGFSVREDASANYPMTFLSLSSSLNMIYLNDLSKPLGANYQDRWIVYRNMLQNNLTTRLLKKLGYHYYLLGSSWEGTRQSDLTDETYNLWENIDTLSLFIYQNSFFNALMGTIFDRQIFLGTFDLEKQVENGLFKIDKLVNLPKNDGPKFVFAHFLIPHPPNVFSSTCTPVSFETLRTRTEEANYLEELQCANQIMKRLVESRRDHSRQSIIIFQSDEGPYLPRKIFNQGQQMVDPITSNALQIHTPILMSALAEDTTFTKKNNNTFRLPKTPVNIFRELFNVYFGSELPILRDESYISKNSNMPYNFVKIMPNAKLDSIGK